MCVIVEGELIVDLWGGWRDPIGVLPWGRDTLVNSFSVGKGVLAILLAHLQHAGAIDVDTDLHRLWPGLSATQDAEASIADVAAHRLGLPGLTLPVPPEDLYDWSAMIGHIEKQEPWWTPTSQHGYHVNTFGFLIGELIRRATGLSPDRLLDPLRPFVGDDMFWSVPDHHLGRCADLQWDTSGTTPMVERRAPRVPSPRDAYTNPVNLSGMGVANTSAWRRAVHPSTNLHSTALGVARAYGALDAPGFVSRQVLDRFTSTASIGMDTILGSETHFGIGFQLPTPARSFDPWLRSFGHFGAGGAMGYHDPVEHVSVGYVMNAMGRGWQNSRNQALIEAISSSL